MDDKDEGKERLSQGNPCYLCNLMMMMMMTSLAMCLSNCKEMFFLVVAMRLHRINRDC